MMLIPKSTLTPFEPLGFPNMMYARKIDAIEIAIIQAFEDMLSTLEHLSNKTPESRAMVSAARTRIINYLRNVVRVAGASEVVVRAAGDGTMIPIEYTIIFDGHTRKLIQYVDD